MFAFESLNGGLFVDGENERVLQRIKIKPHDLGRLGRKVGIVAFAPAFARGQIDLLGAQNRQTYWTSTSLSAAAIKGPVQRA